MPMTAGNRHSDPNPKTPAAPQIRPGPDLPGNVPGIWLRPLLESGFDAAVIADRRGIIRYASPAAARILLAAPEAAVGRHFSEFVAPPLAAAAREKFQALLDGAVFDDFEAELPAGGGAAAPVRIRTAAVCTGPDIVGVLGIVRDVSAEKQLASRLQQARKLLSLGLLTGGIAHDFNNILSPIMLNAEIAMMDMPEEHPLRPILAEIYRSSERARDLVHQIAAFGRGPDRSVGPVKIGPVVKETLKFVQSAVPATIDVRHRIEARADAANADLDQVHQLLLALFSGAAAAMGRRVGALDVLLKNTTLDAGSGPTPGGLEPGAYLELTIEAAADAGESNRDFAGGAGSGIDGGGIRAAIDAAAEIARGFGGAVAVDRQWSAAGGKCRLFIPAAPQPAPRPQPAAGAVPRGDETILVVDDEADIVRAYLSMLEILGYRGIAATQISDALAVLASDPESIHLVVSDMTMPLMTWTDFAAKMRALKPGLPMILISGDGRLIDTEDTRRMKIQACLEKPVGMRTLAETIRKVLDACSAAPE